MAHAQKMRRVDSTAKGYTRGAAPAQLLLEIGVEELPFQFIVPALAALKESTDRQLKEHRLAFESIRSLGTPRRLTLVVEGLVAHQTSMVKEVMGPSKTVALDSSGQPTKAAVGFAASHGVDMNDLEVRQTSKGEYLFAVKQEKGRSANIILGKILPRIIATLSFPKAMKWNETEIRFARPIRWLTVLYGSVPLPVEAAGIKASRVTRGHRVLGGGKCIVVHDYNSYEKGLEKHGVIVDPQRRRKMIDDQIAELCGKTGFRLNGDADLLEQAVYTTECPNAIMGSFNPAYLELPDEILITSLKEHQGFFSVRQKINGKLAPYFIAVANNRAKDMSLIREGNERVLAARLADAKFFFDEDRKVSLDTRSKKLAGVTFHHKLGTMAQKQERITKLAGAIAASLAPGQDELQHVCVRAAALSKADLLTGIVGEFPELQGIMGREYAVHCGESAVVGQAIREQYLPKAIDGELPKTVAGQVLSLADRLDTIASFFHVGIVPSGSEDPFALRRHATAIVRLILESDQRLDLIPLIDRARALVFEDRFIGGADLGLQSRRRIVEFLFERVRHYCRLVYAFRNDVIEAILKTASDQAVDLLDLVLRMKALEAVTTKPDFDPLIVGFRRAHRLVQKERWERQPVEPARFQHPAESTLHKVLAEECDKMTTAMNIGDFDKALEALVRLKPSIDSFFTSVMVNADDKTIRSNRLSLLKHVDEMFMSFADFSEIMVQGD